MISSQLAYVALVVNDVEATANMLGGPFGLRRTDLPVGGASAPVFSVGRSALALFPAGDAYVDGRERPGVHHIAMEVGDLALALERAREAGVPLAHQQPVKGLGGREMVWLAPQATGGAPVCLIEPLGLPPSPDGMVERMDHIGIASATIEADQMTYVQRMGQPLESTQTDSETLIAVESFTSDKYGMVQKAREPEIVGSLRVIFVTVGDTELEILQGYQKSRDIHVERGRPGNTRNDFAAIVGYVNRHGPGLHHIALKVRDINSALSGLKSAGLSMIDLVGRPGSRRALIGFVHPSSLGGVLMHLVERPDSWPPATEDDAATDDTAPNNTATNDTAPVPAADSKVEAE